MQEKISEACPINSMYTLSCDNHVMHLIQPNRACDKHTALLDEAKGHYGNNKSEVAMDFDVDLSLSLTHTHTHTHTHMHAHIDPNQDPLITTLAGVFLLNLQQYTFVARFDHMNLHERV